MPYAVQIDDDAYAIAKAFAEQSHCTLACAVSRLVVKSGSYTATDESPAVEATIRFPLVEGNGLITAEQAAQLEDHS